MQYEDQFSKNRNSSKISQHNNRYSQMEERERRLEAEPVETLEERRAKGIQEIFDFYTRQQLMVGKKATFEQIEHELSNLNMGEFMRF